MSGVVSGGWGYVIAAYAITFVVIGAYVVHTMIAFHAQRRQS